MWMEWRHPGRQAGTGEKDQARTPRSETVWLRPLPLPLLLTWHWAQCGMSWRLVSSLFHNLLLILREDKSGSFLMSFCAVGFSRSHLSPPKP